MNDISISSIAKTIGKYTLFLSMGFILIAISKLHLQLEYS